MQKWYRTLEFWLAVLFGGLAMIAQYLPYNIGIPVGIFFVCIAVWNLWGLKAKRSAPSKRRKILTRPSLKKAVLLALALAAVAVVVIVVLMAQPQVDLLTPETPQDWLWSHPSPREIMESIDALLPYLQDTARQSYEGLSVTWGVTLVSITEKADGAFIQTYSFEAHHELVSFTIDISEYPQLKIMEEGQVFVVQGTITEVWRLGIRLDDCRLIFD